MVLAEACALLLAVLLHFLNGMLGSLLFALFRRGWFLGGDLLFSLAVFGLVLRTSIRHLRNHWQDSRTPRATPLGVALLRLGILAGHFQLGQEPDPGSESRSRGCKNSPGQPG